MKYISWSHIIAGLLIIYSSVFIAIESNPYVLNPTLVTGAAVVILLCGLYIFIQNIWALEKTDLANLMIFICFIGAVVASFLINAHYSSAGAFCPSPEGELIACDIVNHSIYSEIFGIPVSFIGVAGYIFLAFLAVMLKKRKEVVSYFLLISLAGLAYTAFLNYVQFIVLTTMCMLCELSAISMLMLTLAALVQYNKR